MAFTTETRPINDIFQRSVEYSIPRYQRNYVWKEVNWRELLVDIRFSMNNGDEIPWSHFLGTIVLSKLNNEKGIDKYEIIDGQQRLTTIYILIIALYRKLIELNDETAKNRGKYIFNSFISSLNNESQRIPVIKNEDFDEDIKEIIDAATAKEVVKVSKSNNYYNLYSFFYNEFKSSIFDELSQFIDKLLSAKVVEIISDQEEEIYNIFEVLNARGQKLKQIELLKNHIMKYVQPREDAFIDKAKQTWRRIETNSSKLSNPDSLLQGFAKCYIKKQASNLESVYRLIKEEVPVDELSDFLHNLNEYAEVFIEISDKDTDDRTIEYFNIKRNQQVKPLLSAILLKEKQGVIDEKLKLESFKTIRNYFFAFNTFRLSSNRLEKLVANLSYDIYHSSFPTEFKLYLSRFFYEAATLLPDGDLKKTFSENKTFRFSNKDDTLSKNRALVRYVLGVLYELDHLDTKLPITKLTIEHLLCDDGYTDNSLIQNLTLTSSEINSEELENKTLVEKLDILEKRSTIKSNQKLKDYLDDNGNFDFQHRKEDLLNIIFNDAFQFNPAQFDITKEDIDNYFKTHELLKNNNLEKLLNLLKEKGKHFERVLTNDPKLVEEFNRYREIKEDQK
ncbi:DUF262 domain-containing protein [uncultured Streptococcus sp.]|uniref:DUF262 domain-containing protein n=1 Tax=uncultured Streptococcus sp. TaxID=83427 RepID=UPI002880214A|nr:DUF262 domain-containing protein [uncultured Streptococcus sp.]